jgi:hypothetical protein
MSKPNPIIIVDIIKDVVDATNTVIINQLKAIDNTIVKLNYEFGPPLQIYEILAAMSGGGQAMKYPLIALYQPFRQKKGGATGIDSKAPLRIIFARWSNATDLPADRYDNNFRPILIPLYAEFMYQLSINKAIATTTWEKIPHDYQEWPYWDNDGKNPLVDCVDIIELSNLELNFRYKNC